MLAGMSTTSPTDIGLAPAGRERRRLAGLGHRLKAKVMVGRGGVTDAVVEEIRRALTHTDLLKVRIDASTPAETDALAGDVASRVPCHLIQRVGRVALLYKPLQQDANQAENKGKGL